MAIEPVEITDEVSTGRLVVNKRHLHPGGFVHGGVWTAFGDSVAAWATFRALPPMHDFTTIELKLNVFRAGVLGDELICEARPLHVGRSTAVVEAKIRKGEIPVANLIVTQFVLPGRDPRAERPAPDERPAGLPRAAVCDVAGGRPAGRSSRARARSCPCPRGCRLVTVVCAGGPQQWRRIQMGENADAVTERWADFAK